jgi:hypothetical protein
MLTSVLTALSPDPRGTAEDHDAHRNAAAALLGALHPGDAIQHMFAARTAAAHFATMDCFRRAGLPDQPDEGTSILLATADRMERMSVRSLNRLQRMQSDAADRRRPAAAGLAAAIAKAGRNDPMSSEKPGAKPASAAPPSASPAQHRPMQPRGAAPADIPVGSVAAEAPSRPDAPTPPCEHGRNHSMPNGMPSGPQPETALPFDRQAWLAAARSMSPEEQYALANRIQALRHEPPLPARGTE